MPGERRAGRPMATTPAEIARCAAELFTERGYAATSVGDIAARAGIARRTFFSYFATKADAFWYEEEQQLQQVAQHLAEQPVDGDALQQVIDAAATVSSWSAADRAKRRARMESIESDPELLGVSLRFNRRWQALIAAHVRRNLGQTDELDLLPDVVAAALMAVGQTVILRWVTSEDERDVQELFSENLQLLRASFEEALRGRILR